MEYSWYNSLMLAVSEGLQEVMVYLPKIAMALVVLIIGAGIARLLRRGVIKLFESVKVSNAIKNTPVELFLKNAELSTRIEVVIGSIVYWLLMLIVIHTTVSVLGLTSLSFILEKILAYIPRIISAILILFIGIVLSGILESLIKGSIRSIDGRSARLLGKVSSYSVLVLTVMVATSELGIASEFMMILFMGFVGCIALGVGLALGLGGQHLVRKFLEDWYTNYSSHTKE